MVSINKINLAVRNMSSTAAASKFIKPPIQLFGIDGRYATALYSAATKLKQLEAVEKDLIALQETVKGNPGLRDFIISPIIKRSVMSTALKESSEKLRWAPATSNLLQTLADYGRLKKLDPIINAFKIIMAAHRGDVVCEVTSAKPLDDAQRKQLEGALKQFIQSNQQIKLSTKVDPNIIGGLIVSIGDKYADLSIASKVKLYTELISTAA